jgi:hypothetical protein
MSNGAEGEFNVLKNTVAGGATVTDAIAMLRKPIGMPGEEGSIEMSYVFGRIRKIAHIESRKSNMHSPKWVFSSHPCANALMKYSTLATAC